LLPLTLLLLLPGCSSEWVAARERSAQANATVPANYRAEVLALMRTYLNDPSNVRDAFISAPELRTLDSTSRYSVCVRYNPRKSGGQYSGTKESVVLFSHGRLERIIDNAREQCSNAAYEPFRELETLAR
jgi:hypothetical protein